MLRSPDPTTPDERVDCGVRELVFVHLDVTGPDPSIDALVGIEALRGRGAGGPERLELRASAAADGQRGSGADVAPQLAWSALVRFAGAGTIVVLEADAFRAWSAHFEGRAPRASPVVGCDELRALWLPGSREAKPRAREGGAAEVERRLAALLRRAREQPPVALELLAALGAHAAALARESDPELADQLALALDLLRGAPAEADGERDRAAPDPEALARDAIESADPGWTASAALEAETVPITTEDDAPFPARDLELVDAVFRVHLPALAAEEGEQLSYRAGQHEVARETARTLGARELLLVHAPTGTGKTLAYLVPALCWAARHGVRVGVVTYTRALQEQAMDREVPRALRALERASGLSGHRLPCTPRVALLKGRANYVCWRALKLHVPLADDGHEAWLAWLALALFGLRDDTGDLDRLPLRAPFGRDRAGTRGGAAGEREQRAWETLVRQVRAQVGCCRRRDDRATCGAEVARQRAERAHVVIANHAFALVRQSFFKHVVFDECEHLHEQAHAAWSHATSLDELEQLLARLGRGRDSSRAPLDRLERVVVPGTAGAEAHAAARAAVQEAADAALELAGELATFTAWREERERLRETRDAHALLREYVLHERSAGMVAARTRAGAALESLAVALAQLSESLDALALRGVPRLRRQLDLLRGELDELAAAVDAWMPLEDGAPVYHDHTFYDVERHPRGHFVLTARVLLPNEYLGRHYLPELASAVLVSATTWLRGGFDSARGYLGLDRAAAPAPGETREPCVVRCVRAPDPFDYRRVLVALPADAPSYTDQRAAWNAYVRGFIAHLGERTRGRMLVLFTNQDELKRFGEELSGFFSARRIPFWYQGMRGVAKEELALLFRQRVDSILMGVDTFWYGADFPGETLEYLVIAKLPYGVPDRYHHAQCAALGPGEQRRRIYLPRALAKFRQGFGRLMRRESDRGCVFLLDPRAREARHRLFLGELPLASGLAADGTFPAGGARAVRGTTDECLRAAFEHMGIAEDVRRRGLSAAFGDAGASPIAGLGASPGAPRGPDAPHAARASSAECASGDDDAAAAERRASAAPAEERDEPARVDPDGIPF